MSIKEIRERAEKASPGPWIQTPYSLMEDSNCRTLLEWKLKYGHDGDRIFIAHSRTDIPYLLDLIKRARECLEDLLKCRSAPSCDECDLNQKCIPVNAKCMPGIDYPEDRAEQLLRELEG